MLYSIQLIILSLVFPVYFFFNATISSFVAILITCTSATVLNYLLYLLAKRKIWIISLLLLGSVVKFGIYDRVFTEYFTDITHMGYEAMYILVVIPFLIQMFLTMIGFTIYSFKPKKEKCEPSQEVAN